MPGNQVETILNHINSINHEIQFTVEREINNEFPFLDVLISKKQDGNLRVIIYRKPTYTNRYLNFSSHHHHSQKPCVVSSLVHRAQWICTSEELPNELENIRESLRINGYPNNLTSSIIN